MTGYVFDQAWIEEKRRLDLLGASHDRDTFEHLRAAGIGPGTQCLEIGAGSGTVARWMATQVGDTGRVVATDIDVRFLDGLDPSIEVRRHDVAQDPIEVAAFDLIHARTVLQHVPARDSALANLARALRPGGRLVIEDIVMPQGASHPRLPVWERVLAGMTAMLQAAGADPYYGLAVPAAMSSLGLDDVQSDARVGLAYSGTPSIDFMRLSVEQVGPRLVASGVIAAAELDELLAAFATPGRVFTSAIMVATVGVAARPRP